jgi:hypothetical protein
MEYFDAVQVGRARVRKAMGILQDVTGASSPVLFLKMRVSDWTPVGEENLYCFVSGKNSTVAIVICDGEGNAKAISSWAPLSEVEGFARALESRGLARFEGEPALPI